MISLEISKDVDIVRVVVVRDTSNGEIIRDYMGIHDQPADRYCAGISSQDLNFCFNAIHSIRTDGIDGLATYFSCRLNAFTVEIRKGIEVYKSSVGNIDNGGI